MKTISYFTVVLIGGIIYPQDGGSGYLPGEMYLGAINVNPPSQVLEFYTIAQSTVWAGSNSPRSYWISSLYNNGTFIPENNISNIYYWKGWDFVTDITNNPPYPIPIYAYGLYKISTNHSSEYFYLDFRDERYGYYLSYQPPSYGHDIDLWIKYDATTHKFYYASRSDFSFQIISKGQLVNIWQMKQKGTPLTELFPDYWVNCLAVINDGNNHPRLVWGPLPNHTSYTVHRKYGASQWDLIFTTDQTAYVDNAVSLVQPGGLAGTDVKYKVAPVNIPTYFTNEVTVNVVGGEIEKKVVGTDVVSGYLLDQNYPNPFNPSTAIRYRLSENGNIKLVVTNSLGEEVKILDEGFKVAGKYSKIFNSENLPSGIYFCSFITKNGIISNKMLLLR